MTGEADAVEFGVLGSLDVRIAGRPVEVPGARQRTLLAALLIRRDHVVPVDALIDEVFGEAPPREARNALQTYVVRLRQALGPAGSVVVTHAPGYVLEVPAHAVDAERFTALLGQARTAEPPPAALALLDRALELWRGPAYAEFTSSVARGEALRLGELRLGALEDRAGLLLRLDRVAEATAALEAIAAAEPWREHTLELLITALAQAGRTAHAAAALAGYRDRLRDELGLDPSPRLRTIEEHVLRGTVDIITAVRSGSDPGSSPTPASPVLSRHREPSTGTRQDDHGVDAGLRLFVLGGFRAEVGGLPLPEEAWRRSGAAAVVKLLAVTPGHRMHREQLIDVLWPELDQAAGVRRLTKALHFARRALPGGRIRLRDDLLSLEADDLWVDVDAFEAAAQGGDRESALALYQGDLLPENRFDDWAERRRVQVREHVVRLLMEQGTDREARGDPRGAIASFEQLIGADPVHEEAYGQLMRLAASHGERHRAVRWYGRLVANLRDELGVEPAEALRRLYADISSGRSVPARVDDAATADDESAPNVVGEERKLVTVLAVDLRGLQVDPDPEQARRETAGWTDVLCEVVDRWGGAVARPVGGGIVGVFGYPAAQEDHAARALWAGFEILRRVPVPVRLGIDTGEVIAPAAGGGSLSGAGGDVFEVAAGLREAAESRSVLVSDRARLAAHGEFRFGPPVRLGRSGARPLLAADWPTGRPRPASEPPMVGREDETRVVLSVIDEAVASGRPRLLTIVAAAGIGKSRLVHEVIAVASRRRPGIRVLRGRCLAAGDGITYWALGEMLRDACGIALGEAGHVTQQKLRSGLRHLLASGRSEVDETIFALAATAAIPMPGSPLDDAPPRAVADALAQAWPRFTSAAASGGPLVMVVEDLHWAGKPLLDMLVQLAARSSGPVVVLTTARPEFLEEHPGFGAASADVSMISLRSLTERASRDLLDSLPRASGLGAERREEILTRAEGNPYFLEQLVAHVAEGGSAALPDTLHALLAARVDALPMPEKRLLQVAAVVGRVFWGEPLRGRLGFDIADPLTTLETRGLVLARRTSSLAGQVEYAFKHALLRDVAYASLPVAQRARGHAEVAEWLEEISQDRVGEVMELVAYHYAAAADGWDAVGSDPGEAELITANAFRSLIRAGFGARRRYAIAKALELHRRALDYAAGTADRAEALEAIGDDHEVTFDGDAAVEAWHNAIEMLRQEPGQVDRRAGMCLKVAQMAVARWGGFRVPADPALADRVIDEGLTVVREPSAKAQLLALRALCASRWSWTGRPDPVPAVERRRAAEAGQQLANRIGAAPLRALAQRGMVTVHMVEGDYEQAVTALLDQIDLLEADGPSRDRALAHTTASLFVGDIRGDYKQALSHAHSSYTLARNLFPHDKMHGTFFVMACLEQLGRWSEIEPYLDEHLRLFAGPEAGVSCPYIRGGPLVGALALARRGEERRARALAERVPANLDHPAQAEVVRAQLAIELGDADTGRELAERLVRLGRRPEAAEIPHEALALVEACEAQGDHDSLFRFLPAARAATGYLAVLAPTCDRAEGLARAAAGNLQPAEALLTRAVAGFDAMSIPLQAARSRERLAEVRPRHADELLRAALQSYARLGAVRDAARAESARARG
ncbi:MAG TPA: BTAD domain-containing putative transcriptional regulator [Actinoplanes sp.]